MNPGTDGLEVDGISLVTESAFPIKYLIRVVAWQFVACKPFQTNSQLPLLLCLSTLPTARIHTPGFTFLGGLTTLSITSILHVLLLLWYFLQYPSTAYGIQSIHNRKLLNPLYDFS